MKDYKDILRDPGCIKEMKPETKLRVEDYAIQERDHVAALIERLIDGNQQYSYPEGYYPGKLFEYWDERLLHRHRNATLVLEIIAGSRTGEITLENACGGRHMARYKQLHAWFIKEGLCHPDTFEWIGGRKGGPSDLAYYLRSLPKAGYTKKLTHADMVTIARSSFHFELSIDTVKRPKPDPRLPQLPPFKS